MRLFQQNLLESFTRLVGSKNVFLYNYTTIDATVHRAGLLSALLECCGYENVSPGYLNNNYRNLAKEDFDLVVFTRQALTDDVNLETAIKGFIIAEKGECTKHPQSYCVNLVCSKAGGGSILIGLFLYCIYHSPHLTEKVGLLELANSYFNVSGLCAYTKFGFVYDPSLYGNDCFADFGNLPMKADIVAKYGNDFDMKMQGILQNSARIVQKPAICNVTDKAKQFLMGIAMNLQVFVEHGAKDYIVPAVLHDNTIVHYERLFNVLGTRERVDKFVTTISGLSDEDVELFSTLAIQRPAPARPPLSSTSSPPLAPNPPRVPSPSVPQAPYLPITVPAHNYNLRSRMRSRENDDSLQRNTRARIGGRTKSKRMTRRRKQRANY